MSTRQQILEAVYQSIAEKGFLATNINEVVLQLGLTKGAFYYYFKDGKTEVGLAVIEELLAPDCLKRWEKTCDPKSDPILFLIKELRKEIAIVEEEEQIRPDPLHQLLREFVHQDHPFVERLHFIVQNMHESISVGLKKGIDKGKVGPKTKCRQEAWYFLSSLQGAYLNAAISRDPKVLIRAFKSQIRQLESLRA
ncbi:MAG: TetR/AcrR family transcriptional regulator [Bacteroidia bacterium]